MHLMTGIATAAPGRDREAIELMMKYREAGSAAHGLPVSAWSVVGGAPWGTVAISSRVEGIAGLMEAVGKLGVDEAWNALADDAARAFVAPADFEFDRVIAMTGEEFGGHALMSIHRMTAAGGHLQATIEHASKMLTFVHEVAGIDGVLTRSEAGESARLQLIFGVADGAAADAVGDAVAGHPDYPQMADEIGRLIEPGSGRRMLLARLP